ncbi:MAG TPA: ComEC/Rec2 family competence protein [Candidatus Limnocylindrales bacterium]|nr:ComEC/Rec2 family competence protein [Candidatus Limnocylindrales bacterium]
MRLPVLWLAAAFAAGIVASHAVGFPLAAWLAIALVFLALGAILVSRIRLTLAWTSALLAWIALGGFASAVERASVPANHVLRLIAAGQIDLSEPLRWYGRLREDPLSLPWGTRFEIDLEQVEIAGSKVPVSGGLRANCYAAPGSAEQPPVARAGDRVEALLRARQPRNFLDPGVPDVRGALARERIDIVGSLRDPQLLRVTDHPPLTLGYRLARVRGDLLERLNKLLAGDRQRTAILRAMLLGDRSFVDSSIVEPFQKTGAYHVLVVAGLHVGALALFVFWLCRRLRLPLVATSIVTILALAAYVGVVQDRPPIFRAALMAAFYLLARPLFRRIDLLNTIALAALALLVWRPSNASDSSFQLSFLAAGVIAGLALPWIDRTSEPYRAGLVHLGDATRDSAHPPRVAQFRIEMRAAAQWLAARLPRPFQPHAAKGLVVPVRLGLRLWDIVLLSAFIQWGMMPVLAQSFHRVTLAGPLSNIPAVVLTGLIVPLGFVTLAATFVWLRLALFLSKVLAIAAGLLLSSVEWFSRWPRVSYRIPGPPTWLFIAFFAALIWLAASSRSEARRQTGRTARRQLFPMVRRVEWIASAAVAALTLLVATHPFAPDLKRGDLEVTVLDVGQGDSIFTAYPDGRTMLIDGGGIARVESFDGSRSGPDIGEEVVSPYLWTRGLKHIDVVALTHAHHDHLDGLYSVLQNFSVGQLWIGRDEETPAFRRLISEARSLHVAVVHETSGRRFAWADVDGEVLWPSDATPTSEAANDDSLVLRLTDGGIHFLLSGDIQQKVEDQLVVDHATLAADFLKVPHHGSKTSSTQLFLDAVKPKVAVVSAGEGNPFGHPNAEVVARYSQMGVRFFRTDRDGAVTALTNGHTLEVQSFAQTHPD